MTTEGPWVQLPDGYWKRITLCEAVTWIASGYSNFVNAKELRALCAKDHSGKLPDDIDAAGDVLGIVLSWRKAHARGRRCEREQTDPSPVPEDIPAAFIMDGAYLDPRRDRIEPDITRPDVWSLYPCYDAVTLDVRELWRALRPDPGPLALESTEPAMPVTLDASELEQRLAPPAADEQTTAAVAPVTAGPYRGHASDGDLGSGLID